MSSTRLHWHMRIGSIDHTLSEDWSNYMQFKDAAYEILKSTDKPLHYNEITDKALSKGMLSTTGLTPHSTMGALLYTDTLKSNSRFRRGDKKGTFALRIAPASDIQQQIKAIDVQVRKTLLKSMLRLDPRAFENLIQSLLEEMGLDQTSVSTYSGDGGIDIRGVLNAEDLSQIDVAVQAKRWKANVGPKVVRELRGSLKVHEHGIVITPSDFTSSAKSEADESGKTRISLINGEQLVDLLIQHQVGVKQEEYVVPVLDDDYWSEILGENSIEFIGKAEKIASADISSDRVNFPLPIQANHKGKQYEAELLSLDGTVRFEGTVYETPTAAAKVITTSWKAVNGWDFWRYMSAETGKLLKIGRVKKP
jgi:restriction system protein